jgi:hypothetical protein
MKFSIEHNNVITNDPCGICGDRTDPGGLDVFVRERDGSNPELVCVPCIEKLAPELLALQRLAFAAEMLSRTNHIQDLEALILRAREYYESTPAAMHEAEDYKQRCAEREEEISAWEAFCEAQENGGLIDVPRKTN